jgi:hypothetical protein
VRHLVGDCLVNEKTMGLILMGYTKADVILRCSHPALADPRQYLRAPRDEQLQQGALLSEDPRQLLQLGVEVSHFKTIELLFANSLLHCPSLDRKLAVYHH